MISPGAVLFPDNLGHLHFWITIDDGKKDQPVGGQTAAFTGI